MIIAGFSFAPLSFLNNTTTTRWLLDASIAYSDGKLIALLCIATFILFLGLLYTILIFSWQWLLLCPRSKILKWTRNQKLHSFIDTYHIPHTPKHRYWTGLLLLVRVILYMISALTVSIDPQITLLFTIVIVYSLSFYKTVFMIRVYRNKLLNALESFTHFNIILFAIISWYTYNDSGATSKTKDILQVIAAYVSVGVEFCLVVIVITIHSYKYRSDKLCFLCFKMRKSDGRADNWNLSDSKIFDAIDSPRINYAPPLVSVYRRVQDDSNLSTVEYPPVAENVTQQEGDECESSNDIVFTRSEGESRSSWNSLPQNNDTCTKFIASKIKPASTDHSTMKPLLEEDNL